MVLDIITIPDIIMIAGTIMMLDIISNLTTVQDLVTINPTEAIITNHTTVVITTETGLMEDLRVMYQTGRTMNLIRISQLDSIHKSFLNEI